MGLPVLFLFAAITAGTNEYVVHGGDPDINRAGQLLNLSQPSQALELLRPALERHPRDPGLLLLAGLAAYRSDQLRDALCYWKQSLDLAPNDVLSAMVEDAKREAAADHSNDKLLGIHIALRYDATTLSDDMARSILTTLENDYSRISGQLGCNSAERIIAIVQSREQYMRGTSAAEWSGGHFDGRIHIAWTGPGIDRALAHELVHACLMNIPSGSSSWPIWLQEGLAQKLSGDSLSPSDREQLRQRALTQGIPRLESLGQNWFSMSQHDAVAAYNISLAAVDQIFDVFGIRKILANPETLPALTADLDAELGR